MGFKHSSSDEMIFLYPASEINLSQILTSQNILMSSTVEHVVSLNV